MLILTKGIKFYVVLNDKKQLINYVFIISNLLSLLTILSNEDQ